MPDAADIRLRGSSGKICVGFKRSVDDLALTVTISTRYPSFFTDRRRMQAIVVVSLRPEISRVALISTLVI
jgi:hypothetical protein